MSNKMLEVDQEQLSKIIVNVTVAVYDASMLGYSQINEDKLADIISQCSVRIMELYQNYTKN